MREPGARKLKPFGVSVFTQYTALALQHKAINLSQGYPDFDGPELLKKAACEQLLTGRNQYAPSHGMPSLRQAIARHAQRFYQLDFDHDDEVTVFSGATEAIFSSIMGLIDPGDEVLLLDPCYDSYPPSVVMAGGVPVRVPLRAPDYALDIDAVRAAITKKTRMIVVNSPMNPIGKVFSRDELQAIATLCQEFDLLAISDEVYEHIVFAGATHIPLISLPEMRERTVRISSTAKTFSMTGWKIGFACAAAKLSRAIRASHQFVTFCAPPPLQEAMGQALDFADSYFVELREDYARKRDFMVQALRDLGFSLHNPAGTYYIPARIDAFGDDDDQAFCRALPERAGVAAIPISAFYQDPKAHRGEIRIAFCKNQETLQEACLRLAKALPISAQNQG